MPIQILMHISHMMNFYCRLEVTRTGSLPKKCSLFIYIYITQSLSFVKWASKLPLESLCFIYFYPNSINLIIIIITVSLKKGLYKGPGKHFRSNTLFLGIWSKMVCIYKVYWCRLTWSKMNSVWGDVWFSAMLQVYFTTCLHGCSTIFPSHRPSACSL